MTSGSHQMSRVPVLQIATEAAGSHPCREEVLRGLPDISNWFVAQFNELCIQKIQIMDFWYQRELEEKMYIYIHR